MVCRLFVRVFVHPCHCVTLWPQLLWYLYILNTDFYLFRSSTPLGSQGTASPISQHTCHFPLGQGKHSVPISYAELSFFPIYFEYFQLGSGLKINAHYQTPNLINCRPRPDSLVLESGKTACWPRTQSIEYNIQTDVLFATIVIYVRVKHRYSKPQDIPKIVFLILHDTCTDQLVPIINHKLMSSKKNLYISDPKIDI